MNSDTRLIGRHGFWSLNLSAKFEIAKFSQIDEQERSEGAAKVRLLECIDSSEPACRHEQHHRKVNDKAICIQTFSKRS